MNFRMKIANETRIMMSEICTSLLGCELGSFLDNTDTGRAGLALEVVGAAGVVAPLAAGAAGEAVGAAAGVVEGVEAGVVGGVVGAAALAEN